MLWCSSARETLSFVSRTDSCDDWYCNDWYTELRVLALDGFLCQIGIKLKSLYGLNLRECLDSSYLALFLKSYSFQNNARNLIVEDGLHEVQVATTSYRHSGIAHTCTSLTVCLSLFLFWTFVSRQSVGEHTSNSHQLSHISLSNVVIISQLAKFTTWKSSKILKKNTSPPQKKQTQQKPA